MLRFLPLVCLAAALAGVPAAGSAVRIGGTECSVDFQARNGNLGCSLAIAGGRLAVDGSPTVTTAVPGGAIARFGYDAPGRLVRADVDGRSTSYGYDEEGRIAALVGPSGETTSYDYDALNRVVAAGGSQFEYSASGLTRAFGDGLEAEYTYDGRGNLVAAHGNESEARFAYDSHRRVTLADAVGETTVYDYDDGDLVRRIDNGEVTAYSYDRRGSLLRASGAQVVDFSYDADRSVLHVSSGGAVTSFGYDRAGRLARISDSQGGVTELGYDDAGRLDLVIPAIGDEVVIGFEQGDIDRPLVVGALWSDARGESFSLSLRGRIETCSACP
ncbi:MAG TPA: phage baseplate assembly protein V [Gaiellaceae bacterium]